MKKAAILVLSFMLVFLFNIGIVSAQTGGAGAAASGVGGQATSVFSNAPAYAACAPVDFTTLGSGVACSISNACGFNKCEGVYKPCEAAASGECNICMRGCSAPGSPPGCEVGCVADFQGLHKACIGSTIAAQNALITGGSFLKDIVPCNEMNNCIDKISIIDSFKSCGRFQECDLIITDTFKKKVIDHFKADDPQCNWEILLPRTPENARLLKPGHTQFSPEQLKRWLREGNLWGNNPEVVKQTAADVLAKVRPELAAVGAKIPFPKNVWVAWHVLNQNPVFRWGTRGAGIASAGYGVYSKLFAGEEEDEDEAPFNRNNQQLAQNDLYAAQNYAQNPSTAGDSVWTSCPGHRDGRCAGQAFCVTDEQGASQCISALPGGGDVTVAFGSIYIIDNIQKNLFTLKGPQNDGVVYQDDGFVNIDKGGTTKMSVAGAGALITDFIMNRLFLGRGTTTYLGNGNADAGTYLTNTFILDYSSSVGVDAVNPTEQNRLKEGTPIANFKQDNELAFTVNQLSLKPYKNAVDIGSLYGQYQILTRGFSNIVLAEKDKIFPLMTRNFAKGDALIVKNKGVKIPNTYLVNDGTYEYTIKAVDDSTKVFTKNEKIIQDSGPLSSKLSKKQAILIYNV